MRYPCRLTGLLGTVSRVIRRKKKKKKKKKHLAIRLTVSGGILHAQVSVTKIHRLTTSHEWMQGFSADPFYGWARYSPILDLFRT